MLETKTVENTNNSPGKDPSSLPIIQTIECASPEAVAKLDLPLIKSIAQLYSKNVIYPLVKDIQKLTPALIEMHILNEVSFAERDFWACMSRLHLFVENNGVELLLAEGAKFKDDEDRSEFVARHFESQGERINTIVSSMVAKSGGDMGGRTFHLFASGLQANDVRSKLAAITPTQIQNALARYFQDRGYGRFCRPIGVASDSQWGVLVNRGTQRIKNVVLNKQDQQHLRDDRFIKTDAIFFVPETNCLWVHCSSARDARMYAQVIAELIQQKNAFTKAQTFDLSPFLEKDVASVMARACQKVQLYSVEVRFIEVARSSGGKFRQPAGRWDPCLTEKYYAIPEIDPTNQMIALKLRLISSADGKHRADLELKNGSLKLASGLSPLLVYQLLGNLSVWSLYGN
jgi:hypothetical protein